MPMMPDQPEDMITVTLSKQRLAALKASLDEMWAWSEQNRNDPRVSFNLYQNGMATFREDISYAAERLVETLVPAIMGPCDEREE